MATRVPEVLKMIYDLADEKHRQAVTNASGHHGSRSQGDSDSDSEASTVLTNLFHPAAKRKPRDAAKGRVLTDLNKRKAKEEPGDMAKGKVLTHLIKPEAKEEPADAPNSEDNQSIVERLRAMGSDQLKKESAARKSFDKKRRKSQRQDEAVNKAFGIMIEPLEAMKPTSLLVCLIVIGACVALILLTLYMFL